VYAVLIVIFFCQDTRQVSLDDLFFDADDLSISSVTLINNLDYQSDKDQSNRFVFKGETSYLLETEYAM
jgi:hypothetical protein